MIEIVTTLTAAALLLACLLLARALARGGTPAQRLVAVDAFAACAIAACLLAAASTGAEAFLDVAIGFALVAFLGNVGWAHALEQSGEGGRG